ncbi:Tryptophan biosynthesis protein TrpCF [Leclercia adecarboxylata]|uniref:phosphoribosylanthranilate isomerase n=1 Tax=Leclercia adecarboxylata TaxID=83655 RepID=A0A4U9HXJ2_9ENTR|nr:Tryptophan biosynthesis protein TrpCF [Leclercia adecarboxylata]
MCGLTRPRMPPRQYEAGAIYGGLIFVESSPRNVSETQARDVIAAAPLQYVGVFRNAAIEKWRPLPGHCLSLPYSCMAARIRTISMPCAKCWNPRCKSGKR